MVFPLSLLAYFDEKEIPMSKAGKHLTAHFQILTQTYMRNELIPYKCPNCREHGGLYQGYVYINCDECINFFTVDDILKFNYIHS